jgi:lysophospholipase L1-like esterase
VTIVVYGTSLSAEKCAFWRQTGGAWVTYLRRALSPNTDGLITVTNAAKWGSDSDWGLKKLRSRVLTHEPDVVLLEFSVNDADIRRSVSMSRSRENLLAMIQRIGEHDKSCNIVLMTMNPAFGRPLSDRPRLEDYYQIYRDVAEDQALLLVDHMDTWRRLLAHHPEMSKHFPDGLHPDATACERVILPNVLQALQLSALARGPSAG